jgi:hypothetical protein
VAVLVTAAYGSEMGRLEHSSSLSQRQKNYHNKMNLKIVQTGLKNSFSVIIHWTVSVR